MNISQVLSEIGLPDIEVGVYLSCLKLGEATVSQIAKESGSHRSYTYEVLNSLQSKGLIAMIKKSRASYYRPIDPKQILVDLENKVLSVKQILPTLSGMYKQVYKEPAVQVYQGSGMKKILDFMIQERQVILNMTSAKTIFESFKYAFPHFIKQRIAAKIPTKIITEKTPTTIKHSKQTDAYREIRFVSSSASFSNATFIFGNHVAIMDFTTMIAVHIVDKQIASDQAAMFTMLWNSL